jgi:hypothetical protein
VTYPTEYRVERFYPSYYNDRRPQPQGLLEQLSYGGPSFDVSLSADDLFGNVQNVQNASVIVLRTGFSTHTMVITLPKQNIPSFLIHSFLQNMGQRFVQLNSTYTGYAGNNTAILHVSQLPPNPGILAPGPALLFVVVNGSPSVGVAVMVGSGQLGTQPMLAVADLPVSSIQQPVNTNPGSNKKSGATADTPHIGDLSLWLIVLGVITTFCI